MSEPHSEIVKANIMYLKAIYIELKSRRHERKMGQLT